MGLPDASDVETLTDFADIESGRIAEHFLYLGALILFALHVLVLHRLLKTAHQAAALFGAAVAEIGLIISFVTFDPTIEEFVLSMVHLDAGLREEFDSVQSYSWASVPN